MLLALLIFGFGVAQALVQRDVLSSEVKFNVAIGAIFLSAILLAVQLTAAVEELWYLPLKYWIKLPAHRLAMNLFGDHAMGANIHVMYRHRRNVQNRRREIPPQIRLSTQPCTTPPVSRAPSQSTGICNIHDRIMQRICCLILALYKFSSILSDIFFSFAFYVFLVMQMLPYNLASSFARAVTFNDAFSGTYHTRNRSLVVWLQEEHEINLFYDSRGRKVTSKWDYPYVLRAAMPMILRDIDKKRMDLLKRLEDAPKPMFFEQEKLNGFLKCEEKLTWQAFKNVNWEELFKREKAFRWYVLSGVELTQELFELEKLKLQIERLEREQLGHIWEPGQGEEPEFPLRLDFLQHLEKDEIRREQQKLEWQREFVRELEECFDSMVPAEARRQDEFGKMQRHLEQEKVLLQEMDDTLQRRFSVGLHRVAEELNGHFNVEAATVDVAEELNGHFNVEAATVDEGLSHESRTCGAQDERGVSSDVEAVTVDMTLSHAHETRTVEEERGKVPTLEVEADSPDLFPGDALEKDERGGVFCSKEEHFRARMWWKSPREFISLECLSRLRPQEAKCLMATELGEELVVAKVIRNILLEAAFFPDVTNRRMKCVVRATSSQSVTLTNRYFVRIFDGSCDTAEAAELFKLLEILDDNAFVASPMQMEMQVDIGHHCRQWRSSLWISKTCAARLKRSFFPRRIFVCESIAKYSRLCSTPRQKTKFLSCQWRYLLVKVL